MTRSKSIEEIKAIIEAEEGYTLISTEYKSGKTSVDIRHSKCNTIFPRKFDHWKRGQRCPECNKPKKHTNETFQKAIDEVYGKDIYLIKGEYINLASNIEVEHLICGHVWNPKGSNLRNGHGCPECGGSRTKTIDEVKQEVFDKYNGEYELISETYNNNKEELFFRHNNSGCNNHVFQMRVANFLSNGQLCTKCNLERRVSRGEKKIEAWLIKNKIPFRREKRFKQCRYKQQLPFDFYVKYKGSFHLIEYDGKQHFKASGFFTIEKVKRIQKCDSIKTKFAKQANIPLLRIPYTEYRNVETILEDYFKTV